MIDRRAMVRQEAVMRWRSPLASSVLLVVSLLFGCTDDRPTPTPPASSAASTKAVSTSDASTIDASSPTPAAQEREIVGASQVLVAYKGAELAPPSVTRSKADAKKRAEEALAKITKDGLAFDDAAKLYSDDPGSNKIGGALGNFERSAMPEAFSKAAFALAVGEVSSIVETPRGFHIIKRTR